jgi:RNA polymerase sigma-70 factor (ECF subfamily)
VEGLVRLGLRAALPPLECKVAWAPPSTSFFDRVSGSSETFAPASLSPDPMPHRSGTLAFPDPIDPAQAQQDLALLQRTARGDRAAFAGLYDRFSRPLFATALRILGDAREAEDVVHDVFITLWQRSVEFSEDRGSPFSWAVTMTRNRAIDRVRQRRRRAEILAEAPPKDLGYDEGGGGSADSGGTLDAQERAGAVRRALATLPRDQQRAVELAFFSGLTQQEIAENLRQPLGTVKARIRRGLLKLRDVLIGKRTP